MTRPDPFDTDRLRAALAREAAEIEPDPRGLANIEEKLMEPTGSNPRLTQTQRWILGGTAGVAAVLAVIALFAASLGDDDPEVAATDDTTTTEVTTTTTEPTSTTTTTTFTPAVDPFAVAFPAPQDSQRFQDPVAAGRAYATDVLGFTRLEIRDRSIGDEVATLSVSARDDGPVTIIELSLAGADTWFALGSTTADIEVAEPAVGASLATPFGTTGRALAFEGTVDVVVLTQDGRAPLGSGFVTGSGTPPAGPFDGRIFFSPPREPTPGILVYRTLSPEDGHVEKATSFPVRLTSLSQPSTAARCGDTAGDDDGAAGPVPDERIVKVYFHCGTDDYDDLRALRRTIPGDEPRILGATLIHLLAGPTEAERDAGFSSVFPVSGASLRSVVIDGGVAEIDLSGEVASLANSSANILVLRSELFRTATQFSSVAAVEVRFDGSCEAFATWSQSESCLITG